ncbi:MAG: DNA primase [Nitrosopumilus sp. H8]|nr:MAG: DNA primase [Nitrosopumilus sp. H13]RNJ78161.1 MAG: DNA primase [Nitrosopumilus sp. H8]
MLVLGQDEFAKYPFLADAGEYLKDKGFTLEQFGTDPDLRMLIDKAFERIQAAADGAIYKSELTDGKVTSEAALPREVFSFLLAIVLLKLCGMRTLFNRFALAEARRAEKYLERDLGNIADKSREDLAIRIIDDLFSVRIKRDGDDFAIPVPDYLKYSVNFYEREWKLVNRRVYGGLVYLTPHETIRLLRAELGVYIASKITRARTPQMIQGFEDHVGRLVDLAKKFATPVVYTGEYPPCIKHAIDVLERGENLPHSGRFMLGAYLLSRGQAVEDVAPLFKNAPDYNERVTLYQLNNLAGSDGGTQYSCPTCDKLRTQDLCFATSECDGITHPMQFGRKK